MNRIIDLNAHIHRTRLEGMAPRVQISDIRLDAGGPIQFAKAVVNIETGHPISIVGRDYKLVEHQEILSTVESAINRLGLQDDDVPRGIFLNQRGSKMRCLFKFPTLQQSLDGNDILCPVVRIKNSYDGSSRLSIEIGAFRFVCTNFAIGGGGIFHAGYNAIHQGVINVIDIQAHLEDFLARFNDILETFRRWIETPWTTEDAFTMRDHLAPFGDRNLNRIAALIDPASTPNRFRAFNAHTFHATHLMRTANAAFRFLDATNQGFQRLDRQDSAPKIDS